MAESWHLGPADPVPSWKLLDQPRDLAPAEPLPKLRLRSAAVGRTTLYGRFSAPGEWAEINSLLEGHFLERMASTAFEKTIEEKRDAIRVLFHHGQDPSIGFKVLGRIDELRGDTTYEVSLFDEADYVRQLIPGLQAGQYGVSFRFKVVKDELRKFPTRSAHNPKQLPEITVTEADLVEFGPTPTPAYKGPSAAVRSSGGLEHLLRDLRSAAHLLTPGERWRTRPKPGCPGVIERERVGVGMPGSWDSEHENNSPWMLPPSRPDHWRLI
jgi:phage head maturation protease